MSLRSEQSSRVFFTWTAQNAAQPIEIVSGEGSRVRGADGTLYWDLCVHDLERKPGACTPGDDPRAGGGRPVGGRGQPFGRLPREGPRRRAAGGDLPFGAEQVLPLPLRSGSQRERREDGALAHRSPQSGDPNTQLPRRDPGDAVALRRPSPRSVRTAPPGRRPDGVALLLPVSFRQRANDLRPRVRRRSRDADPQRRGGHDRRGPPRRGHRGQRGPGAARRVLATRSRDSATGTGSC